MRIARRLRVQECVGKQRTTLDDEGEREEATEAALYARFPRLRARVCSTERRRMARRMGYLAGKEKYTQNI